MKSKNRRPGETPAPTIELGGDDPVAALRLRANELIAGLPGPPFHLDCPEIRSKVGINQIRYSRSASVHGRIFWRDGGYVIEVASALNKERQAFTLAHEIAHTFFLQPRMAERERTSDRNGSGLQRNNEEERLCDIAASEMLMPAAATILGYRLLDAVEISKSGNAFLSRVCAYGPSVRSILLLAREFATSLVATARRFAEMGMWHCHIGFWKLDQRDNPTFAFGFTSKEPRVLVSKAWIPPSRSIIRKVVETGEILRGWSNVGLTLAGENAIDRAFVEAAFLPQARIVLTMAVLEPNAGFHCMQVEKYEPSNKRGTSQRSLPLRDGPALQRS